MALSPAEKRARRDARARERINPDTGQPFRNYNQLDTWQRNQKAKQQGYSSRGQKRYHETTSPIIAQAKKMPEAYAAFRGTRKISETSAREFLKAFGPVPPKTAKRSYTAMVRARKQFLDEHPDWDWSVWRDEYSAI